MPTVSDRSSPAMMRRASTPPERITSGPRASRLATTPPAAGPSVRAISSARAHTRCKGVSCFRAEQQPSLAPALRCSHNRPLRSRATGHPGQRS